MTNTNINDVHWLTLSLTHTTVSFTHTVCTCWRRVVRTGNKHKPTERSSQTAGPATREQKYKTHILVRQVCTNREQQDAAYKVDQRNSPHRPEAPHRDHHRSWTGSGWLLPALSGTHTKYVYTTIVINRFNKYFLVQLWSYWRWKGKHCLLPFTFPPVTMQSISANFNWRMSI